MSTSRKAIVDVLAGCLVACLVMMPAVAQAQDYPVKPIRLIVSSAPGGGIDITSRTIQPKLSEYLGRPLVLEYRPGGNTIIGTEAVARAAPDGYTLLTAAGAFTVVPHITGKMPYDPVKDFAPISQVVQMPNILVAHPSLPARSVKELVALGKSRPGQVNYSAGSAGSNPHLAMELFLSMTGTKIVHVPYKGQGPSVIAVVSGEVSLMMGNVLSALPHVKNGRLRAIGVTSAKRAAVAPEVPTVAETGVPGYEVVQWYGLLAPANTPRDIIAKVHSATTRALQDPATRQRFIAEGGEPVGNTPEEFTAIIGAELKKWGKVIREAGIKPE
jgi:tripartite-type tricarboxylate transporter receptor subunit TctC